MNKLLTKEETKLHAYYWKELEKVYGNDLRRNISRLTITLNDSKIDKIGSNKISGYQNQRYRNKLVEVL